MNGDRQLPHGEQYHPHQQDAAHHRQQHHHGIRTPTTLWFFQSGEDGLSAGVFRIRELHDTVVFCLIETEHRAGVLCVECFHGDDFILAEALAGVVVREPSRVEESALDTLPLGATCIGAGGALLTGVSERPRLAALTAAAHTAPSAAAHLPVVRDAAGRLRGAVTVVPDEACVAFTLPAVTFTVT